MVSLYFKINILKIAQTTIYGGKKCFDLYLITIHTSINRIIRLVRQPLMEIICRDVYKFAYENLFILPRHLGLIHKIYNTYTKKKLLARYETDLIAFLGIYMRATSHVIFWQKHIPTHIHMLKYIQKWKNKWWGSHHINPTFQRLYKV